MGSPLRAGTQFWLLLVGSLLAWQRTVGADDIPPDPAPRWWKGNLHTHSFWSDGDDFPEMIAEWYRTHGYHFLALSDHNVLAEGLRWLSLAEVEKRAGPQAMHKYLERFGPHWVELRTNAEGLPEVRLKPLSEYRALVEERGRFLMIPSEEISARAEGLPVHLNATNIEQVIRPLAGATVRETIEANVRAVEDQARRRGREILVHLNHPNFGFAITAEDLAAVLSERFFEVYNGHKSVAQLGDGQHAAVEYLWDVANTLRVAQFAAPPLFGLATDDSHDYHEGKGDNRPGRGWVMVRARHLTPESLIRAMRQGDFYASTGVTLQDIRYDREQGVLEIEIDPAGNQQYHTQFIGTLVGFDPDSGPVVDATGQPVRATRRYSADVGRVLAEVEGLHATYQLTGNELYVRAVVTASQPHPDPSYEGQKQQAWTQPVGWERHVSAE